jgi:N-acyl-D-amino-acid deacylase
MTRNGLIGRLIAILLTLSIVTVVLETCRAQADTAKAPATLPAQPDIVVRGGRIIDGAGNPWFHADIAIRDGRILAVGDLDDALPATKVIDASGLVIAPGFIDVHTHADEDLLKLPQAENFVRDGVTTIVTGNCGYGVRDVGEYFVKLTQRGIVVNVATLVGHNTVLRAVKGNKAGKLTSQQMTAAKQLVREAMRDGAVGLSTGLIYSPGQFSDTGEIIELARVAAEFGGIYATHMRSESTAILEAIEEALRIGREANCRVQISHFKLPSDMAKKLPGGSDATLQRVLDARAAGQEVWLDQYPYTASSTGIGTLLPDWILEDGPDAAKAKLAEPEQLARVLADMRDNHEIERGRRDMSYVVLASCRAYPQFVGGNLKQVAQAMKLKRENPNKELLGGALPDVTMEEQYRAAIDIYMNGGASVVLHSMDEAEVVNILRCPLVAIASDSGVREFNTGQPHPRGYGTNARVLGRYVREQRVITLEDAVRKMTSLPAAAFRFRDRGLLREGFVADVTIFDPQRVIDRATFETPHAYAEGIEYVIVNGKVVLEQGKMTGAIPGTTISSTRSKP